MADIRNLIDTLEGAMDENERRRLRNILSDMKSEARRQRFGLVWEDHAEDVERMLDTHIPLLTEEDGIQTEGAVDDHLLIEGDNLHALIALRNLGRKVDVIYIDPPYNTGNEFVYNDTIVDREDAYRHSKWLSFMEKRLKIAKELLNDDGMIFVSIDDNEQARLKLLMDQVFGPDSFITQFHWESNPAGRSMDKFVANTHEYILMYAKDRAGLKIAPRLIKDPDVIKKFSLKDDISPYRRGETLHNHNHAFHINNRPNLFYAVYYNDETHDVILRDEKVKTDDGWVRTEGDAELISKGYHRILPRYNHNYGHEQVWRWGQEKFMREWRDEIMFMPDKETGFYPSTKDRIDVDADGMPYKETFHVNHIKGYHTGKGAIRLKELFGRKAFNFPKPHQLVMHLAGMHPKKDAVVLDFFAGSGTTGDAVLQMNLEDGGHRRFILCTNNEGGEEDASLGICRAVTFERIKAVISGRRYVKGSVTQTDGVPANLTFMKVELTPRHEAEDVHAMHDHLIAAMKAKYLVHSCDEIAEGRLYRLRGRDADYYLYDNDYVDPDDLEYEGSSRNIIYVDMHDVTDRFLMNRFDEVHALQSLLGGVS